MRSSSNSMTYRQRSNLAVNLSLSILLVYAPAWAADSIRQWNNASLHFTYDLTTATYDCQWTGGAILRGATSSVRMVDDSDITPADYPQRVCADGDVAPFSDEIGT